jgi:hypothetical protein
MTDADKEFIDMLVAEFRKDNLRGWSMCDVLDVVMATGASVPAAREYLLKEVFDIPDEKKFINQRIMQAKKTQMNVELFDKGVQENKVEV